MSPATTASDEVTIAIEGEAKGTYPPGMHARLGHQSRATSPRSIWATAISSTYDADGARYVVPGYGTIDIRPRAANWC